MTTTFRLIISDSTDPENISDHLQTVLDYIGQGTLDGEICGDTCHFMWELKQEEGSCLTTPRYTA